VSRSSDLAAALEQARAEAAELRAALDAIAKLTDADRLLRDRLRDRFVVTTVDDRTFDGLLAAIDERSVVLVEAAAIAANGDRAPVDGELILRRDQVAYLQRPPGQGAR
jgi:hypothetical protein